MPAISPDDAAIIRRPYHSVGPVHLCIWPLRVVATAKINGTPDYSEPFARLPVDNTSAGWDDIERGFLIRITDPSTGALKYEGVMRGNPDPDEISFNGIRAGDSGTAQTMGPVIADNDDVTVYDARIPASSLSRLDDDGELLKRWGMAFDPAYPQSRYFEPNPRFGRHRHVRVRPGENAALTFDADPDDLSGNGTLEHVWRPPSGWTQTDGADEFDTPVTYAVPAGNYIMRMTARRTVHDNGSDSSIGSRYVFVTDGPDGANPAFSDLFPFTIESSVQDRTGRTDTYLITCNPADADLLLTYLYPGAFCLLDESATYRAADGTSSPAPAGVVTQFCGHLRRYDLVSTDNRGVQTWRVTFQSWSHYCDSLPIPSQLFEAADAPETWYQVYPDNMTVARILWMILFYHTEMARLYDIVLDDLDDFETPDHSFFAGSLLAALQQTAARVHGANIGCASDGTLYARRHLSHETPVYRAALGVVWTWLAGDWKAKLEAAVAPLYRVGQLLAGFQVSGVTRPIDAYKAQAGYLAQAQGVDVSRRINGLIALDEPDGYARIGHAFQNMNRPIEAIPGEANGNIDVIDPALMEPHKLALYDYAPLHREAFGTTRRVLPLSVSRTYTLTPRGLVKSLSFTMEPETLGQPAPPWLTGSTGVQIIPLPAAPPEEVDPCAVDYGTEHHYCWDLTDTTGDWSYASGTPTRGKHTSGTGFESNEFFANLYGTAVLTIRRTVTFSSSRLVKRVEVDMVYERGSEGAQNWNIFGGLAYLSSNYSGTYIWTGSAAMPNVILIGAQVSSKFNGYAAQRGYARITGVRVWYDGPDAGFSGGEGD